MISLVIVSHSSKLAEGVCELVRQATQGQVPIAAAGGIDDPFHPIGTDAMRIFEAIETVFSPDGVIVLMDLGSALLSAETALEFLTDEQRPHVYLCSAPLVEGAFTAAAQATTTTDVMQILAEAQAALGPKRTQLKDILAESTLTTPLIITPDLELHLTIHNRHGLHARPAAQFVMTASRFQSTLTLSNLTTHSLTVNAKSINQIATLGVQQGHEIVIKAAGPDAAVALAALKTLAEANFGESPSDLALIPTDTPAVLASSPTQLVGIPVSAGIVIGPVQQYRPHWIEVVEQTISDVTVEWQKLQNALHLAENQIQELYQQALVQIGPAQAAIFQAHLLFLSDPSLIDQARQRIFDQQMNAASAWQATIQQAAAMYRQLPDSYMQARATDVLDVGQRVLKLLTIDQTETRLTIDKTPFSQPVILVAADLTPSDTAELDPSQVLGICTELGSPTSHSAIIARSLGIPAVVGLGETLSALANGTVIAFDGQLGRVWLAPTEAELAELFQRRGAWLAQQLADQAFSRQKAITQDGHGVQVVANIGSLREVSVALTQGAEGVGLLRSEFLYFDRHSMPSEDEQTEVYRNIAQALGPRPLIIRTLDIGGDKPLPYLDAPHEENPFLGWRGIRIGLDRPEILKTQLRAILRASYGHDLKIMFPMVATLDEVRQAKAILAEARQELQQTGYTIAEKIEVGIMIEVPAAVIIADQLAQEVDFFSLGTNDLSQYSMAADRTNQRVAPLADAFQPAVLRLIQQTIEMAHQAGIWVSVCGELAGNPLAAPLLLGFGLDEFSMSAPAIPSVKQAIRQLTLPQAQTIALAALKLESAQAVREYVAEWSGFSA